MRDVSRQSGSQAYLLSETRFRDASRHSGLLVLRDPFEGSRLALDHKAAPEP